MTETYRNVLVRYHGPEPDEIARNLAHEAVDTRLSKDLVLYASSKEPGKHALLVAGKAFHEKNPGPHATIAIKRPDGTKGTVILMDGIQTFEVTEEDTILAIRLWTEEVLMDFDPDANKYIPDVDA